MLFSLVRRNCSSFWLKFLNIKMSLDLEKIVSNNMATVELLNSLKSELNAVRSGLIARKKQKLMTENLNLLKEIEVAKSQLMLVESRNGKNQIPIPNDSNGTSTLTFKADNNRVDTKVDESQLVEAKKQQPKEKKIKKEKPPTSGDSTGPTEAPIDVGRLDFRIGKIIEVSKHPDADSLYLEKIDCGESQPRTVVSGLVKFVPIEEMQNRMVVVLCNLKPAKMRGITSEAMVMCASTPDKVEILSPPNGVIPGDLVNCNGYERKPDAQLNPKKKIFETCAPDLMTNSDLIACFKGSPLNVSGKGNIVAQTLKNVNVK